MATIPSRLQSLQESLSSLYYYVDEIYVMLNGYESIPQFVDPKEKIRPILLDNSLGDAAKCHDLDKRDGFVFFCDDDLVYPSNYVSYMLAKYEQYKCIITLHGKVFQRPVRRAHGGFRENYHCLHTVIGDHIVDTGGTGVMLINTNDFRITPSDCSHKNMFDIWVGKKAHELGVKIMCVAHSIGWLKYLSPTTTIWNSHTREEEAYQVKILTSFIK